ncbi:MAG: hypothetical protein QM487_09550 [Candidatus Marithrix sp.]
MFNINQRLLFGVFILILTIPNHAYDDSESQTIFKYLTSLSLEELGEVEITPSNIFDSVTEVKELSITIATKQSVTSIITTFDIEVIKALDLDEIVKTVSGLHIPRKGYFHTPIYNFQLNTENDSKTLMLVNGIPIASLFFFKN